MGTVFHKNSILNNSDKAWELYRSGSAAFGFPERITIEITNRCNFQCFMCPRNNVNMKLGDIEVALFKKIIDEISSFLPVCLVPFFRGESFLHPEFLEMLVYAKKKHIKPIQLATNAYFLNSEMAKRIIDIGIDFISFSIDVNDPQIYEKIKKSSDFEKVFSNILFFVKEKAQNNVALPEVQVSAVKAKENSGFIHDFVGFWKDKVDRVRIYSEHSQEGKLGHLRGDNRQGKRKPCLKLLTDAVIYWNGDVAICNHDWQRDIFIGNVINAGLNNIWNSEPYRNIRQRHLDNNLKDFSPCNYCSHWRAYYQKNYFIGELYEKNTVSHR